MGRGIGYKAVLSMIKVAHDDVKIQSGGMIFFFLVCKINVPFNPLMATE